MCKNRVKFNGFVGVLSVFKNRVKFLRFVNAYFGLNNKGGHGFLISKRGDTIHETVKITD